VEAEAGMKNGGSAKTFRPLQSIALSVSFTTTRTNTCTNTLRLNQILFANSKCHRDGKLLVFATMNKGKIMRKLLGQPIAITNETTDADPPQLRPTASQNTIFKTRASLACLDRSPDGHRVVVAGQKVFKTLTVNGSTITEDVDLRSIISSYASSHDITAATADQLNIRAVKWSHGTLDTTIITACGNGRITLYDLNRVEDGLEVARIHEHARQVHKLDVNPFNCNWLLSASQDGTVRSFDLRTPFNGRSGPTFRTWYAFKCNADAVRDVKWSPTDGFEFACSTDAGVVQKWDARRPNAPLLKITAHQTACCSISWHPDGDHLVSGGMDQYCHVWDVSKSAERGQRPRYTLNTPAPVSSVSWRPACWSATAKGNRAAQVTVTYDDTNTNRHQTSNVHLWDIARPGMPFKEIEQWDSSPTGLFWNTRDLLWSVDKEGYFTQTDVAFVPKLIDRRSLSSFAFSPTGDVLMLLEERQAPRRRPPMTSPEISPSFQHGPNGPLLSVSRSDSEEDVVGSFLGPRIRRRRRHSERAPSLSNTPPSNTGLIDAKVMSLDDAVKVTGMYKPQQTMAIGHAPSTAKRAVYQYFTIRYLERIMKDITVNFETQSTDVKLASTLESFARTAEGIAHFRLAQTWRLLAYTMNLLLTRRSEFHRQSRLSEKKPMAKPSSPTAPTPRNRGDDTPRRITRTNSPFESPLHPVTKSIVNEEIESTSNVATPLVRPVRDQILHETREAMHTPLVEDDILELPEPANSPFPEPIPVPSSSQTSGDTSSSLEGYDFYGLEVFTPAIDFVAPVRKAPLRLDYSESSEVARRMQPQRHDSGESFAMFSTSGDSQSRFMDGSSGSDDQGQAHSTSLRDRVSSWENSLTSHPSHRPSMDSLAPTMSESSDDQIGSHSFQAHREALNGVHQVRPPTFRIQEASFRSAADPGRVKATDDLINPLSEQTSSDPNIIESDYLPWVTDPEFVIPPIDPKILVQRSITFEAQTGALNASAMVLLLRPLLPDGAIDEIQARAILAQYHRRLMSLKLFTEAALLRNLCVPLYPTVFAVAQENVTIGFFCTDCHKPLENDPSIPNSQWRCPRCQHAIDGCAVCLQRDIDNPEFDAEDRVESTLWWYCPGCGHGGHTICMNAWHAGPEGEEGTKYSGGCCPLEGCLHPCLPGTWREKRVEEKEVAKQKELDMLVRESSRQSSKGRGVRRDTKEVTQSKAVEGVRVALGLGGGLDRKKSVKVIAPGEEEAGS
jgi:WD40 repeat protein